MKETLFLALLFVALAAFLNVGSLQAAERADTVGVAAQSPQQQGEAADSGDDDQATVNWTGVLIPLIVVLVIIFAVGLFLMRIWHWIDPT